MPAKAAEASRGSRAIAAAFINACPRDRHKPLLGQGGTKSDVVYDRAACNPYYPRGPEVVCSGRLTPSEVPRIHTRILNTTINV